MGVSDKAVTSAEGSSSAMPAENKQLESQFHFCSFRQPKFVAQSLSLPLDCIWRGFLIKIFNGSDVTVLPKEAAVVDFPCSSQNPRSSF